MSDRILAIGDIHGCSIALDALLAAVQLQPGDTLITLGDYVDRGPDSRGVLDRLIALRERCHLVPLLGNHDVMLLMALDAPLSIETWRLVGGNSTLASYEGLAGVPAEHVDFIRGCRKFYETDHHLFIHANYLEDRPLAGQPDGVLLWESLRDRLPGPHISGKHAILGHTSQKQGDVLEEGHLTCIDTYCCGGRWLTAMDVGQRVFWQVNPNGRLRNRATPS